MYIRRTLTRSLPTGEHYHSHRLVRSERVAGRVRQVTLLNLGQHFVVTPDQWQALCFRIEEVLAGQVAPSATVCEPEVEREAQRLAALLLTRQARTLPSGGGRTPETVDLDSLELVRARSVGVELVGLWAVAELRLAEQIQAQGMSLRQVWAAVGTIVARMAAADAEGGILSWWGERSAIGELLGVDFTAFSPALLSRAADSLLKHRMSLEEQVFARVSSLFGLSAGESIYELSRACFNGAVGSHATARFGNAREVQNDGLSAVSGPLTLGLVLDHSGFIRRSAGFVDHTAAGPDLKAMLDELGAPPGALVRIGQGVASAASLAWLRANGFRTLVVTGDHVCTIAQDLPLESGPGRAEIGGDGGAQLFISVLSHQCVQVLRRSLLAQGIDSGWPALCQTLSGHCRVTTSLRLGDGRTLHVRQATRAEPEQLAIYQALGIDPAAGGVQKTVI